MFAFLKKRIPKLNTSYIQRKCGITATTFRSVDSTNKILKEYARQDAPHGTVVVAEAQTAGRGRGEHTFFSPLGTGVYLSVLLRYEQKSFRPADVTAAAGVAACEAIEKLTDRECKIKWMNDVYIDGKKVAGILAEAGSAPTGAYSKGKYVVVGIGFNVTKPDTDFPEEIRERAGAIFSDKAPRYVREELTVHFYTRLMRLLGKESASVYAAYRDRLFILGETVEYEGRKAIVRDLLPDFRLVLDCEDGTVRYLDSGEVSLLQPYGIV